MRIYHEKKQLYELYSKLSLIAEMDIFGIVTLVFTTVKQNYK